MWEHVWLSKDAFILWIGYQNDSFTANPYKKKMNTYGSDDNLVIALFLAGWRAVLKKSWWMDCQQFGGRSLIVAKGLSTCPCPVQYFNIWLFDELVTGLLVTTANKTKLESKPTWWQNCVSKTILTTICWVSSMATHSSILAWKIPWTEEADGLHSMGLQRVTHGGSDLVRSQALLYTSYLVKILKPQRTEA